jgi:SEC-C motif
MRRAPNFEDFTNDEAPLKLELHCNRCSRKARHEVPWAMWYPEAEADGWDGIVLGRVIDCRGCGAVDDYTLTTMTRAALSLIAVADAEGPGVASRRTLPQTGRVIVGLASLWDGTVIRRPSQGLSHLRALAEGRPQSAEAWRRLGNLCERYGLPVEAEEAWRKAACNDDREWEAVFSLARHLLGDRPDEGFLFVRQAVERLPRATINPEGRVIFARALVDLIFRLLACTDEPLALIAAWPAGKEGADVVVHVSSVDLREVTDGDRLVEFMARTDVASMGLTPELPTDRPTQLEQLLDGEALDLPPFLPQPPHVRTSPRVGRNEQCACGSGKKHKKCCLGQELRAPSPYIANG